MGRKPMGIYKKVGLGKPGFSKATKDMLAARQLAAMSLRSLVTLNDRVHMKMFESQTVELDVAVSGRVHLAMQDIAGALRNLDWCCNAIELSDEPTEVSE